MEDTTHVSIDAIAMKKREFHTLRQGSRTVGEYNDLFNNLARYSHGDVATNATRQEKFLEGLNDEISIQLVAFAFYNDQFLINNTAIQQ
jgi:hypothetical protein